VPRGTQDPRRKPTPFTYGTLTLYGSPFQYDSARDSVCNFLETSWDLLSGPTTPAAQQPRPLARNRFGLLPFRSPLLREWSLFLRVLRCFSSPRSPQPAYIFSGRYLGISPGGFPHSGIPGSQPAHGSPRLIAVYHALLRLLVPRHPPYALSSLIHVIQRN
jgi:hypothetical protein